MICLLPKKVKYRQKGWLVFFYSNRLNQLVEVLHMIPMLNNIIKLIEDS